ncbi:hypothetical protein [Roseovarius sp. C03]|uniref:hypothetical protein n=1 Tax=Roseovarius sp. C03 TaxID=3449222 RepID=UPI003EDC716B
MRSQASSPDSASSRAHHRENLLEIAKGDLADPGAAVGFQHDEAVEGEHLERLA